jgi:hypothetical protein
MIEVPVGSQEAWRPWMAYTPLGAAYSTVPLLRSRVARYALLVFTIRSEQQALLVGRPGGSNTS